MDIGPDRGSPPAGSRFDPHAEESCCHCVPDRSDGVPAPRPPGRPVDLAPALAPTFRPWPAKSIESDEALGRLRYSSGKSRQPRQRLPSSESARGPVFWTPSTAEESATDSRSSRRRGCRSRCTGNPGAGCHPIFPLKGADKGSTFFQKSSEISPYAIASSTE